MSTEPDALESLGFMRDAARLISRFTEGKSFSEYERDVMLRSAVERQFIIIGESVNLLLKAEPEAVSRITEYRRIVDFRNRLAHRFFHVNNEMVWNIINNHLPVLRAEVAELIEEYER